MDLGINNRNCLILVFVSFCFYVDYSGDVNCYFFGCFVVGGMNCYKMKEVKDVIDYVEGMYGVDLNDNLSGLMSVEKQILWDIVYLMNVFMGLQVNFFGNFKLIIDFYFFLWCDGC